MTDVQQLPAPRWTIGRDLGPAGRWVRLVVGTLGLSYGLVGLVTGDDPNSGEEVAGAGSAEIAFTLGSVAAVAVFYLVLHRLLAERVFARVDPWFGTVIVIAPLGLLTAPMVPEPVQRGTILYISAATVLTALIRYGGCEVVALPTLLAGRRHVLYCPWNAIDAAERPLRQVGRDVLGVVAVAVSVLVGGYVLLVEPLLARFELADPVAWPVALLLLGPAGLLGYRAWRAARTPASGERAGVLAIGALALTGLALVEGGMLHGEIAWAAVMVAGVGVAIWRIVRRRLRRSPASPAAG